MFTGLLCHGIMAPILLFWYITVLVYHFLPEVKSLFCILPPHSSFFFFFFFFFFLRSDTIGRPTFFTTVVKFSDFFSKFESPPIGYLFIKDIFVDSHSSFNFNLTLYVFSAYHSKQSTFRANEIWIIYLGVNLHQIIYYFPRKSYS